MSSEKIMKWLQFVVLLAILGLLLWSQPWNTTVSSTTRKITVTGEATLESEPDEYFFTPYFQKKGSDKDAMKAELTTLANDAVAKLKELGVEEKDIKVDASSYDYWYYLEGQEETNPMTVNLTVTVGNKELAQKVQDYLQGLDISGQLTPQATFSKEKQKELSVQGIEEASKDAKSRAEKQAQLLGAKVGKVIEVQEGGYGIQTAYSGMAEMSVSSSDATKISSLPVMPGENEYTQTVTIIYELK